MIKPTYLLAAVVSALQDIPTLVALMGQPGVASIYALPVIFPDSANIIKAIEEMPEPGIMLVYQDLLPQGRARPYAHRLRAYFRGEGMPTEDFAHEALNGEVASQGLNIRQYSVIPEVETMNPPGLTRITDREFVDMFYSDFVFEEIGDN